MMTDLVLTKSSLFYLSLMNVPILKSSTKEVRGSSPEYLVSVNTFWEARPPFLLLKNLSRIVAMVVFSVTICWHINLSFNPNVFLICLRCRFLYLDRTEVIL